MRSSVLIFFLLLFSLESFSQAQVLAVNRVDKRTGEVISIHLRMVLTLPA